MGRDSVSDKKTLRTLPSWRLAALLALALVVAGFAIVRGAGPAPPAWYPPCPFHALTGLWCPGCGSARVLHDLAHGHLLAACQHNILIVALAPFLLVWAAVSLWRGLLRNQPPLRAPLGAARLLLIVIMVFWIARNLPWQPFSLLAPAPWRAPQSSSFGRCNST
jgi:hypothetical protein